MNFFNYFQRKKNNADIIKEELTKINTSLEQKKSLEDQIFSLQEQLLDVSIRVHDIQDQLQDVCIRTHDSQDRIYDLIEMVKDSSIRTKDVQDKLYDTSFQIKTYDYQNKLLYWQMLQRGDEPLEETKRRFFKNLPSAGDEVIWKQKNAFLILKRFKFLCEKNNVVYWLDYGTLLGAYRHEGFIPWDDDIDVGIFRDDLEKIIQFINNDDLLELYMVFTISKYNFNNIIRIKFRGKDKVESFIDVFIYDRCGLNGPDAWTKYLKIRKELVEEAQVFEGLGAADKDEHGKVLRYYLPTEKYEEAEALVNKHKEKLLSVLNGEDTQSSMIWGIDNLTLIRGNRAYSISELFPLRTLTFEGIEFSVPNNYVKFLKDRYGEILQIPDDLINHVHFKVDQKDIVNLKENYEQLKDAILKE